MSNVCFRMDRFMRAFRVRPATSLLNAASAKKKKNHKPQNFVCSKVTVREPLSRYEIEIALLKKNQVQTRFFFGFRLRLRKVGYIQKWDNGGVRRMQQNINCKEHCRYLAHARQISRGSFQSRNRCRMHSEFRVKYVKVVSSENGHGFRDTDVQHCSNRIGHGIPTCGGMVHKIIGLCARLG